MNSMTDHAGATLKTTPEKKRYKGSCVANKDDTCV